MRQGFGIDTSFNDALQRWRERLNGHVPVSVELVGPADALLPTTFVAKFDGKSLPLRNVQWPDELPATRKELHDDPRVWALFTTEWSFDDMREYLGLGADAPLDAVKARMIDTQWWREFEEMVVAAFVYEWRQCLEVLARDWDETPRLLVCRPDPEEHPLEHYEEALANAAATFDARFVDAQLLYSQSTRIVGFMDLTTEG
jgi:hypothetical protein